MRTASCLDSVFGVGKGILPTKALAPQNAYCYALTFIVLMCVLDI